MSKLSIAVFGIFLVIAAVSFAQEPTGAYSIEGMPDPYAGPTPSGMRFGETPHVVSATTGDEQGGYAPGGCPNCGYGFGVHGLPCDPCWSGPCVDWKTVGWYSHWGDKVHNGCSSHGCGRRCCGSSCSYSSGCSTCN